MTRKSGRHRRDPRHSTASARRGAGAVLGGLVVATRTLGVLVILAVMVLGVIDGGVVGYAHVATEDDAKVVARAAAEAVRGERVTEQTAVIAYQAAESIAHRFGATVPRNDFTVHSDGQVTLTLQRSAPTLVFDHLPFLRDTTTISTTVTVEPPPYS
jgi:hypothetical protein